MSAKIEVLDIQLLSGKEVAAIDSFVETSPFGNIFQTIKWGRVCNSALGCKSYVIMARDAEKILGTLLFTEFLKTKHFIAEDGPVLISDDSQLFNQLYECYSSFCQKARCRRFELHILPYYSFSKTLKLFNWRATREIHGSLEEIWKGLDRKSIRHSIKTAMKKDVIIFQVTERDDYLHHLRLAKLSKIRGNCPLHLNPFVKNDRKLLNAIIDYLPNNHVLFCAKFRDQYIASALWLYFGKSAYYYDVGLDFNYKEFNAADFLMWRSIEFLNKLGIDKIDLMGLSSSSSSMFKRKWSDELVSNRYFIWTRPDFYVAQVLSSPDSVLDIKHFLKSVIRHSKINRATSVPKKNLGSRQLDGRF